MKTKLKNELITEYVEICKMKRLIKKHDGNMLKKIDCLKKKYEQIFLKIGFIDLAFFILRKEVNSFEVKDSEDINNDQNTLKNKLNEYALSLELKMKKLFFNEFEISFIKNFM